MTKRYKNLKIRTKILLGFCVVAVIMLFMTAFTLIGLRGIISSHENLAAGHFIRRDTRYDYRHAFEAMQRHTNAMIMYSVIGDQASIEQSAALAYYAYLAALASLDAYNGLVRVDYRIPREEQTLRISTSEQVADILGYYYSGVVLDVLRHSMEGDYGLAVQSIRDGQAIADNLHEVNEFLNGISDRWIAGIEYDMARSETVSYAVIAALLILIVLLSMVITFVTAGSISKPIKKLSEYALQVSKGDFKSSVMSNEKDEIGQLQNLISEMTEPMNRLITDLERVSEEADRGGLSMRIAAEDYIGSYREAAEGANKILQIFVGNLYELTNIFKDYADGHFDKTLKQMRGESVIFNETAYEMQKELKNIYQAVLQVVDSGDLRYRLDPTKHKGDWNTLVSGLNRLLESFTIPIAEAKDVLQKISQGNLTEKVKGNYRGDFAIIATAVNSTVATLNSYIGEMSRALSGIAAKNLTASIDGEFLGDFVVIKDSVNNISSTLRATIREISSVSEQVLSGAQQISAGAADLAAGATEQAGSIQELNESVDLINRQTHVNAKNAEEANNISYKSTQSANDGNRAMNKLLAAMREIKESSDNVFLTNRTIQDIAFQTNLISLNASVEAARAGEHGKGFSVVAEEVRNLAARSKVASEETTGLISNSIERVDNGSVIAESTAMALDIIAADAAEMLEIMKSISVSSQEQADAIGHVSAGINRISSVVQSNTSLSEETAAAAEELNSQAELLRQLVSDFRT